MCLTHNSSISQICSEHTENQKPYIFIDNTQKHLNWITDITYWNLSEQIITSYDSCTLNSETLINTYLNILELKRTLIKLKLFYKFKRMQVLVQLYTQMRNNFRLKLSENPSILKQKAINLVIWKNNSQNPAVNRLQPITNIRQSSSEQNRHSIRHISLSSFLVKFSRNNSLITGIPIFER